MNSAEYAEICVIFFLGEILNFVSFFTFLDSKA